MKGSQIIIEDLYDFIKTLNKLKNFKILYKFEKKGLAKYKDDNPVLGRIILKRK